MWAPRQGSLSASDSATSEFLSCRLVLGLGVGVWVLGVEVLGLGCGVWGLGFGVWGLGSWVWGVGFGVFGSWCGDCRLGFEGWGLGFGVSWLGFRERDLGRESGGRTSQPCDPGLSVGI